MFSSLPLLFITFSFSPNVIEKNKFQKRVMMLKSTIFLKFRKEFKQYVTFKKMYILMYPVRHSILCNLYSSVREDKRRRRRICRLARWHLFLSIYRFPLSAFFYLSNWLFSFYPSENMSAVLGQIYIKRGRKWKMYLMVIVLIVLCFCPLSLPLLLGVNRSLHVAFLSGCKVTGMERGSIRVIIDVIINRVVKVTLTVNENVSDVSSSYQGRGRVQDSDFL